MFGISQPLFFRHVNVIQSIYISYFHYHEHIIIAFDNVEFSMLLTYKIPLNIPLYIWI